MGGHLELADRIERAFDDMSRDCGSVFKVMCLMSDGLVALGSDGSLEGETMGPREIAAELRSLAARTGAPA